MTLPYIGIKPKEFEVTIHDNGRTARMRVSLDWIKSHTIGEYVFYADQEIFGQGQYVSYRPIREKA